MEQAELNTNHIATKAGYITVYNYDSETYEYIGSVLEYLQVGVGIPAYSCIEMPMETKLGFTICRAKELSSWQYVRDHRGESVYCTETGVKVVINVPGDYPKGTTTQAPVTEYDTWNGSAWVTDPKKIEAAAEKSKVALRLAADAEISWRQDAVDIGVASLKEAVELDEWKKYRVLLMRVDTSKVSEINWPERPS